MDLKYDAVEVWFSSDDEKVMAVVMAYTPAGEKSMLGAEQFGPFDTKEDVSKWVWARLNLDDRSPFK